MKIKELEQLQNDLLIATAIITSTITEDEIDELLEVVEERYNQTAITDIKNNTDFLLEYSIEIECYEASSILKSILEKLKKYDK